MSEWTCQSCLKTPQSDNLIKDEAEIKITAVMEQKQNHILERSRHQDKNGNLQQGVAQPTMKRKIKVDGHGKTKHSKRQDMKKKYESLSLEESPDEYGMNDFQVSESECRQHSSVGTKSDTQQKVLRDNVKSNHMSQNIPSKSNKRRVQHGKDEDRGSGTKKAVIIKNTKQSARDLQEERLEEIESGDELCTFCDESYEFDGLELGPLYRFGTCRAHLHCLMFSSGLIQVVI